MRNLQKQMEKLLRKAAYLIATGQKTKLNISDVSIPASTRARPPLLNFRLPPAEEKLSPGQGCVVDVRGALKHVFTGAA